MEAALPLETTVEAAVPLETTVEALVPLNTEIAEDPEALKSLASCGAHWQSECLHEPPCQKHAVAAAFLQMLSPPPSAASVEHHAIVPLSSPPSREGEGCCYCNPMKHEKLLEKKQRLAKELAEALKKGLDKLVEQGMIPAASVETGEAVDDTKPNEGGGDSEGAQ